MRDEFLLPMGMVRSSFEPLLSNEVSKGHARFVQTPPPYGVRDSSTSDMARFLKVTFAAAPSLPAEARALMLANSQEALITVRALELGVEAKLGIAPHRRRSASQG